MEIILAKFKVVAYAYLDDDAYMYQGLFIIKDMLVL